MACPKKKTSKRKRRSRHATWARQANVQAQNALTIGYAILSEKNTGFYFPEVETSDGDE